MKGLHKLMSPLPNWAFPLSRTVSNYLCYNLWYTQYYPGGKEHFSQDPFSQAQQIDQVVHLRLAETLVLNPSLTLDPGISSPGYAAIIWAQLLGLLPAFNFA